MARNDKAMTWLLSMSAIAVGVMVGNWMMAGVEKLMEKVSGSTAQASSSSSII